MSLPNLTALPDSTPTGYWIVRDDDGAAFSLCAAHQRHSAVQKAEQYEQSFGEKFTVRPEYDTEVRYGNLPNAWEADWMERVPYSIAVTDVPEWAVPDN